MKLIAVMSSLIFSASIFAASLADMQGDWIRTGWRCDGIETTPITYLTAEENQVHLSINAFYISSMTEWSGHTPTSGGPVTAKPVSWDRDAVQVTFDLNEFKTVPVPGKPKTYDWLGGLIADSPVVFNIMLKRANVENKDVLLVTAGQSSNCPGQYYQWIFESEKK